MNRNFTQLNNKLLKLNERFIEGDIDRDTYRQMKIKTGKLIVTSIFPLLWCGPGLNRRHKDFQSFALPTELPHLS
jgi:hypothetical protein